MREDNPVRREVITLLSTTPLTKTTVVQLWDHKAAYGDLEIEHDTMRALQSIGEVQLRELSQNTYSVMGKSSIANGFGAAIPCAPGHWLVLKRVMDAYNSVRLDCTSANTIDTASWNSRFPFIRHLVTEADQKHFNSLVLKDTEALFGTTTEFSEYFDVTVYQSEQQAPSYMIPDVCTLRVGDPICVISYNGYPERAPMERIFNDVYKQHPKKPTYEQAHSLFCGLGKKTASFGYIRAISNTGTVTYDCSLVNGASGGIIYRIGADTLTFCGIHEGGEFDEKREVAYNYGYLVSHVGVVLLYAKYIYPLFQNHVPGLLLKYFQAHKKIIEQHIEFINNNILSILE